MPKLDLDTIPAVGGCGYPPPHDAPCQARSRQALGDAAGLTQFGVNLLTLPPGGWSSQRHYHAAEDEFVWVVSGEAVLVTDMGEQVLRAGEGAGFKAGAANGHHLQNRGPGPALLLEIGSRRDDVERVDYPDIDMVWREATGYTRKDGIPLG